MKTFLGVIAGLVAVTVFWMWFNSKEVIRSKTVVALGDSLVLGVGSESGGGFVDILSQDLGMPITNLGRSGDTTADILGRIAEIDKYKPDVVILLAGGNDFLRGVPEQKIFENLGKIIDEIESRGSRVLLLGLENSRPGKQYKEFYESLVDDKDISYVPDIMGKIFANREYLADGLHPNDKGYQIIAEEVRPYLERSLKP